MEPRGLIITTMYPPEANICAFQRKVQESSHAPCGPPWMRNFTGYFFLASNAGGFTMKPSTFLFSEPVNQNGSSGEVCTCAKMAPFMWVKATPPASTEPLSTADL